MREFSAAALADLALLGPNHDEIVALSGIVPIVTLLRAGSHRGKQHASAALARLADGHDDTSAAISAAGAIPPLVALLGGEFGGGAQEEGAHALYALADNEANRQYITQADGIVPLVELLGSENSRARGHAERALVRLSIDPSNRIAIINKLVSMLIDAVGQEQAAAALANLAKDSADNRKSIVVAGGIAPLLSLLSHESMRCRENAVSAVKALAYRSREIQGAIAAAGGIPLVASMLTNATSNAKEMAASTTLCSLAAEAVESLSEGNEANQIAISEAGGIHPLVIMLGSASNVMQATAAGALGALSMKNADNQAAVARTGAIAPLAALVKEGLVDDVKEQAAAALWALADNCAPNKATVAKLGGIEPLVTLLVSGGSQTSLDISVGALGAMSAKHADNREAIAKQLVAKMSSRMAMVGVPDGAVRVLAAVSMLSLESSHNQVALAKAGGVPPLIMWLSGGFDAKTFNPGAQQEAVRALLSIVSNNGPLQTLVVKQEAGLAGLIRLLKIDPSLKHDQAPTQEYAARTLWHLATDPKIGRAIAAQGGLPPLVTMLSSSDSHAQELSAIIIVRLSRAHPSIALTIAEVGGIPPLVQLIRDGSPTAQQQAAAAIAEVCLAPLNRSAVAKAGGIEAVVHLLTSRVVGTSEVAARALAHLARDGAGEDEGDAGDAKGGGKAGDGESSEPASPLGASTAAAGGGGGGSGGGGGTGAGSSTSASPNGKGAESSGGERGNDGAGGKEAGAASGGGGWGSGGGGIDGGGGGGGGRVGSGEAGEESSGADGEGRVAAAPLKPGAQRRQRIRDSGGITQLVVMLMMPKVPGVAQRMGELVNKVLGLENGGNDEERSPKIGPKSIGTVVIGAAEQAAATISDIAHGDLAMQQAVIAERGVPPLLLLMRNGSSEAQEHACRAVWHLCEDIDSQGAVVDCGAIAELVMLSRVGDAMAQELAAAVISDLAKGAIAERERDMQKHGRLFAIKEMRPMFQRWREHTTFRGDDRLGEGEGQDGGGMDGRQGETFGQQQQEQHGGDGEKNLAASEDEGGGGDVGGNDAPAGAPDAATTATTAAAAAEGPKDRLSAIAEAGGIVPLVGLVTTGNPMSKERAASALWHLSVDPMNQVAVAKAGGIPPLVQLLDDGTDQAHQHAADALDRLANENDPNQLQMAKQLVGLVSKGKSPGSQRRAAHTLWELALNHPGAAGRVVNAGAISPLVTLLGVGTLDAKEEAAGALTCLAEHDPNTMVAIASGLVALLGTGTAEAQEHVTQLLIHFSKNDEVGARGSSAENRCPPPSRSATSPPHAYPRLVVPLFLCTTVIIPLPHTFCTHALTTTSLVVCVVAHGTTPRAILIARTRRPTLSARPPFAQPSRRRAPSSGSSCKCRAPRRPLSMTAAAVPTARRSRTWRMQPTPWRLRSRHSTSPRQCSRCSQSSRTTTSRASPSLAASSRWWRCLPPSRSPRQLGRRRAPPHRRAPRPSSPRWLARRVRCK